LGTGSRFFVPAATMIEFYPQIFWVHVAAVIASGSLFTVRGILVQVGSRWGMAGPVRYLSYGIDTVLLTAALMLVTILPGVMFANGWLAAKLVLLVAYVVLGTFALKRGRTPKLRRACFVAALAVFAIMIGIARAHHPLGWLRILFG
jgi:uncharacterized membrane protein SirB2